MAAEDSTEVEVCEVLQTTTVQKAGRVMRSRLGTSVLAAISFIEAVLPVPLVVDPFLVAAVLANRMQVVRLIVVTTVASVLGGACAYGMAMYFLDPLLALMPTSIVEQFQASLVGEQLGTLAFTLVGALTPIPYTIVAWVVSVLQGNFLVFLIGSVLGRGFRYAVVGYVTYRFGQPALALAKRYLGFSSLAVLIFAVLYFWLYM